MFSIHLLILNNPIPIKNFTLKLQGKRSYTNIAPHLSHWTHVRMKLPEEIVSSAVVHVTIYFLPKSQDDKMLKGTLTLRGGTGLRSEESFL